MLRNDCMGPRSLFRLKRYQRECTTKWVESIRLFGTSAPRWSGHNRWSKIKHDKGREDALKSKARSILSQDIYYASKYGGSDPDFNPRLSIAIANAKKGSLSKASIESAIAKGQGKSLSGAPLENVTIEAMLPLGVAAVIECQTDQKARVLQDIRFIINRSGGSVTQTSFLFDKKGRIWFERTENIGIDEILDQAIEAGAVDVNMEDNQLVVDTEPSDVTAVAAKLSEKYGLRVERSEIFYDPKEESLVQVRDEDGQELQAVISSIEEEQSLQSLYINAVAQT